MSIKFGFKKTISTNTVKVVVPSFSESNDEKNQIKDYVESISGSQLNGKIKTKEEKKTELVIPLIQQNRWRVAPRKSSKNGYVTNGDDTPKDKELEEQAVKEILESTKAMLENETHDESSAIPLLLRNRIPTGFETDDNMDVSLRAEESTIEDYDRVPVSEFGLAMLRGMGWTKDSGIGSKNKKVVEMKEPQLRPKGLGLGASAPSSDKDAVPMGFSKKDHKDREVLTLKIGAYVLISKGTHENNYGQIQSFDEDNNRVIVKLENSSKLATVSKFNITLVSEREYSKQTRDSKRSRR